MKKPEPGSILTWSMTIAISILLLTWAASRVVALIKGM